MKFKFQWINKIVEKLPEELKEKRKAEIGSCFIGTKKQLDEKVRKSLYEQVKIISVATIIFLIVLFLTIIFYFSQDRRILITRDETGGEVTEQQIRIKTKSDDDIYTLEIHPKGYTKAQITQAFDRGEAYLRKHLVAKNKSLNEVERNLEMPVKIPGENIAVQWQSDDPTGGTHIEILLLYHLIGFDNLRYIDHIVCFLNSVHHIENFLALAFDLHAHSLTNIGEFIGYFLESFLHLAHVYDHHHVEILLYDGLRDIQDVDTVLCQIGTYLGDDTNGILAHYCNNRSVHVFIPYFKLVSFRLQIYNYFVRLPNKKSENL